MWNGTRSQLGGLPTVGGAQPSNQSLSTGGRRDGAVSEGRWINGGESEQDKGEK